MSDTGPLIFKGYFEVLPLFQGQAILFADINVPAIDLNQPPARHRLYGVGDNIMDGLLHLAFIDLDRPHIIRAVKFPDNTGAAEG